MALSRWARALVGRVSVVEKSEAFPAAAPLVLRGDTRGLDYRNWIVWTAAARVFADHNCAASPKSTRVLPDSTRTNSAHAARVFDDGNSFKIAVLQHEGETVGEMPVAGWALSFVRRVRVIEERPALRAIPPLVLL
jgi:hypothetical protein